MWNASKQKQLILNQFFAAHRLHTTVSAAVNWGWETLLNEFYILWKEKKNYKNWSIKANWVRPYKRDNHYIHFLFACTVSIISLKQMNGGTQCVPRIRITYTRDNVPIADKFGIRNISIPKMFRIIKTLTLISTVADGVWLLKFS